MIPFLCKVFTTKDKNLLQAIDALLLQIEEKELVIKLTFFGTGSNISYFEILEGIKSAVSGQFSKNTPLVSFVVQPCTCADEMAVEVYSLPEVWRNIPKVYRVSNHVNTLTISTKEGKYFFADGLFANNPHENVGIQSDEVFATCKALLHAENFEVKDIIRQWNYIGHITQMDGLVQNYQAFNDSRSRFYGQAKWPEGYPAATGISMEMHGVIVSFIAFNPTGNTSIFSVNSPVQLAAHAYSPRVLVGRNINTTPKFERAKLIISNGMAVCYISGTAAIHGEQSSQNTDAVRQTIETINNIKALIASDNLHIPGYKPKAEMQMESVRVYVRNAADFAPVKAEIDKIWPKIPTLYTQAGICRRELLVEIEGVASGIFVPCNQPKYTSTI